MITHELGQHRLIICAFRGINPFVALDQLQALNQMRLDAELTAGTGLQPAFAPNLSRDADAVERLFRRVIHESVRQQFFDQLPAHVLPFASRDDGAGEKHHIAPAGVIMAEQGHDVFGEGPAFRAMRAQAVWHFALVIEFQKRASRQVFLDGQMGESIEIGRIGDQDTIASRQILQHILDARAQPFVL